MSDLTKYISVEPNPLQEGEWCVWFNTRAAEQDGLIKSALPIPRSGRQAFFHFERAGDKFICTDENFSQFDTQAEAEKLMIEKTIEVARLLEDPVEFARAKSRWWNSWKARIGGVRTE